MSSAQKTAPAIEALCALPGLRQHSWGWTARCPAHDDSAASLSFKVNESGTVLLKCHAGCTAEAVCAGVGLQTKHLFPEKELEAHEARPSMPAPRPATTEELRTAPGAVATYTYHDRSGAEVLLVVRRMTRDGKDFRQFRSVGADQWLPGVGNIERVLYRLPAVLQAASRGETVFVVEGEKDAETLKMRGLVATTSSGGASAKWINSYTDALRGAHVVVLPDNDEPGRKHARKVADALAGAAASVKVVELPGLPEKGDVTDWMESGRSVEELMSLVSEVKPEEPAAPAEEPDDLNIEPISHRYGIQAGRFVLREFSGETELPPKPLCNFTAKVLAVEFVDDGTETEREMKMQVSIARGRTHVFTIQSSEWPEMKSWLAAACAHNAIVYGIRDAVRHISEAISLYSMSAPHSHVYTHTGWVKHDGGLTFLLPGGAVAGDKMSDDASVRVTAEKLEMYQLVDGDAARAYEWVEELFRCADLKATAPLLATIFLAPLASAVQPRYSLMFSGESGSKKTSLVAAALNLFGTKFSKDDTPTSFHSTANNVELVGHWAKDLPLLIDNYVPRGNPDAPKMLFRILHSAGDGVGRGRVDRTGRKAFAGKPYRCIPIITGEDFPTDKSDIARAYVVEMTFDSVKPSALARVQDAGARGELMPAMLHYLRWLHGKMADPKWADGVRDRYLAEARKMQSVSRTHGRLIEQVAWFHVALDLMTESHPRAWKTAVVADARIALANNAVLREALISEHSITSKFFQGVLHLANSGVIHARATRDDMDDRMRAQGSPAVYGGMFGWRCNSAGMPDQLRNQESRPDLWIHMARNRVPYLMLEPDLILETYKRNFPGSKRFENISLHAVSNALLAEGFLWLEPGDHHRAVKWTSPLGKKSRWWRINLDAMVAMLGLNGPDASFEIEDPIVRVDE